MLDGRKLSARKSSAPWASETMFSISSSSGFLQSEPFASIQLEAVSLDVCDDSECAIDARSPDSEGNSDQSSVNASATQAAIPIAISFQGRLSESGFS